MQSVRQSTSLLSPSVRELASQPARSTSQWVSHRTFLISFIHAVSQSVSMVSLSVSQPTRPGGQRVSPSVSQSVRQSVSQQGQTDTSWSVSQSVMQPARPASYRVS